MVVTPVCLKPSATSPAGGFLSCRGYCGIRKMNSPSRLSESGHQASERSLAEFIAARM
jgi:hypothetical protein